MWRCHEVLTVPPLLEHRYLKTKKRWIETLTFCHIQHELHSGTTCSVCDNQYGSW